MDNHAVVVADKSGTIQLWSAGAERLFGHTRDQAVGKTLDLIVPEEFRSDHWTGFRRAMDTGDSKIAGQPFDIPVRQADGTVTPFFGMFVLVRDAKNATIGAMAIFNPPT